VKSASREVQIKDLRYVDGVRQRLQFGVFEFDPATGELWRSGVAVRLQPQPARVLAALSARAGDIVSRDELRRQIWNDGTFVDFERGLNFCVAQIRSALGDSADSPRFIETLPRRGYRFIAPVRVSRPASVSAPEPDAIDPAPVPHRRARRWQVAAAVVLVGGLAAAWYVGATRHAPVRIAVVPFDNETGQENFDGLARGIADATVARLAAPGRVERLDVIGNSAALRRPRSFRDLKEIGQQVRAEYVVLAQVKRDETRVRLIAHLIRVSDEAHVWAETFDRPSFTLEAQAEIAEAIAAAVLDRLTKGSP
jgi:DNA-binding winged helix-turn-helix (wHTH) protein/TolB-like protein